MIKFKKDYIKSTLILLTIVFLNSSSYADSLRLPIESSGRVKQQINLQTKIAQMLDSDKTFAELLDSGDYPFPLKEEGLNYTSFMFEGLRQICEKINSEGVIKIERISVVNDCSLVKNMWMPGSDLDRLTIVYSGEFDYEIMDYFYELLARLGVNTSEFSDDATWITTAEDHKFLKSDITIYYNGNISVINNGFKSTKNKTIVRAKLFDMWMNDKFTEKEKKIIVDVHEVIAKNAVTKKIYYHTYNTKEEKEQIDMIKTLVKHGLAEFITDDAVWFKWFPVSKGTVILKAEKTQLELPDSPVKCLVLDCDGVLWEGTAGEDGAEGIELTPDNIRLQEKIKECKDSGVVLTINSKNDLGTVLEIFKTRKDMVLKREDFAAIKANWDPKPDNILKIAEELNIGVDSLFFVDNSPREVEAVRTVLPEKNSPMFTSRKGQLDNDTVVRIMDKIISDQGSSEEDRKRTKLYDIKKKREEEQKRHKNILDYYYSLGMKIIVRKGTDNSPYVSRIAQLTQRTNQFNLTGKKYNETQVREFLSSYRHEVYTVQLIDKFGDEGILGVAIVERDDWGSASPFHKDSASYLNICLSCRAIGLGIEKVLTSYIDKRKDYYRISNLRIPNVKTGKNHAAREAFFNENGDKELLPDWIELIEFSSQKIYIPDRDLIHAVENESVDAMEKRLFSEAEKKGLGLENLKKAVEQYKARLKDEILIKKAIAVEIKYLGRNFKTKVNVEGDYSTLRTNCMDLPLHRIRLAGEGYEIFDEKHMGTDSEYSPRTVYIYDVLYALPEQIKTVKTPISFYDILFDSDGELDIGDISFDGFIDGAYTLYVRYGKASVFGKDRVEAVKKIDEEAMTEENDTLIKDDIDFLVKSASGLSVTKNDFIVSISRLFNAFSRESYFMDLYYGLEQNVPVRIINGEVFIGLEKLLSFIDDKTDIFQEVYMDDSGNHLKLYMINSQSCYSKQGIEIFQTASSNIFSFREITIDEHFTDKLKKLTPIQASELSLIKESFIGAPGESLVNMVKTVQSDL